MDNNNFEDWGRKLSALLPESASQIKQDIEKNVKFFVKDAISRMDLVKRSELEELQSNFLIQKMIRIHAFYHQEIQ